MANEKLLPANVTLLLAYPEAFADPAEPTAAELNAQFNFAGGCWKHGFQRVLRNAGRLHDESS